MLINVFGNWINPNYVISLFDTDPGCWVTLTDGPEMVIKDKTADKVAEEINYQIIREEQKRKPFKIYDFLATANAAKEEERKHQAEAFDDWIKQAYKGE
jgi:hypothetical protein